MAAMERLTWVSGSFPARVLAARLGSEGIDVELRGALDGPYGLTVGDMSRVDLFVPTDQMDDATIVMLACEIDATLAAPREWAGEPPPRWRRPWARWAALAALGSTALAPVVSYFRA